MPEYFFLPEIPGRKHFHCDRHRANLSLNACADMWRDANLKKCERRAQCKLCPIGAAHAGQDDANLSPLRNSMVCSRCMQPTQRLIKGLICVSCYNRQREWVLGKNAKGCKPVKLAPLAPRCIRYLDGRTKCSLRLPLSKNTEELVITVLRRAKHRVRFFPCVGIRNEIQHRLFN